MTPKEKARELVNKYLDASFNCKDCDMPFCDVGCTILMDSEAQECALIAVDEILNQDTSVFDKTESMYHFEYWGNVKDEIEKL
jgi:hypothetical protein